MGLISQVLTLACGRICVSFMLVVLLNSDVCLGATLKMTGSPSEAVLNESFTWTCTVTQAANLDDRVTFSRRIIGTIFAALWQNNAVCSEFTGAPDGYTASCGSGTDSSSSTTKTYTLMIDKVGINDVTVWGCFLSSAQIYSPNVTLQAPPNPNPQSQVSESTIVIIVVVAVLLVVAIAVSWVCYKRMKQQRKSEEEKTENKTQEAED
ncbi:uncharacterized protein LOC121391116 [Gigantopelta aegis]|uniref:uncharacterized protein LOC121391116 n=1 Tax=Gigantopelta aegis TaxID=1735272 RepID=UPI001B887C7B|nr:uncharacterized protein LOC121391116 [Gigantopelta aegis]